MRNLHIIQLVIDNLPAFLQPDRNELQHTLENKMAENRENPLLLIADDDPELMGILLKRLQNLNCEIITAPDGIKTLELIKEKRPDLVILDVMMPRKNGWEVCKEIRQDPTIAQTGVIMLTGIGSSLNEMTSPLYGADEYLDKPFSFSELTFKIKRLLSGKK
jgi:DNA-binding response OmpR family regulator